MKEGAEELMNEKQQRALDFGVRNINRVSHPDPATD